MIWAEHELSCLCEVSLPAQLHLCRSPSKNPPQASLPFSGVIVNLNFLHSLSGAFMPPLSSPGLPGRLTRMSMWDLVFLSQPHWPENSSVWTVAYLISHTLSSCWCLLTPVPLFALHFVSGAPSARALLCFVVLQPRSGPHGSCTLLC